ncbi:uncharacterized protein with TBP-like fold DUF4468 [Maribacter spongiicola]|uniref:Uncharacterized protein with TBP-like fold DUF4468 n=1 Tax=Maribacter spongiicola TaxID=1206753 RepID=A0A4R7K990_9FLAO|nr:DUF4468 domain-containing protein [Maribacter spongiicola]TDT47008.1 uncharacterized protein with TBP-like fold DUF4468 [Maribacter spongiicola]
MKKLLLLTLLLSYTAHSQLTTDPETYLYNYKQISEVDLQKDELANAVEKWFAVKFKDSDKVIRLSNDENIIGKGYFTEPVKNGKYVFDQKYNMTIDIAFKEGRYKLEFYDFYFDNPLGSVNIPITYFENVSLENYKEYSLKSLKYFEDPKMKKAMLKQFEKGKIGQEQIDNTIRIQNLHRENLEKNLEAIANELNIYLNKEKDEDDW